MDPTLPQERKPFGGKVHFQVTSTGTALYRNTASMLCQHMSTIGGMEDRRQLLSKESLDLFGGP